ncbi:hypothetical protein EJ08DRAFT_437456 [Tothia fuscella]|uniref:Uncharacterized protein n=1 Tax=Tothia fuscella TaxID=1048955 RepID=A0A9P4P0B1_9PEZI|nr:hypothetical protein EJ08DRAFT_437456 [Tothia fuscella]
MLRRYTPTVRLPATTCTTHWSVTPILTLHASSKTTATVSRPSTRSLVRLPATTCTTHWSVTPHPSDESSSSPRTPIYQDNHTAHFHSDLRVPTVPMTVHETASFGPGLYVPQFIPASTPSQLAKQKVEVEWMQQQFKLWEFAAEDALQTRLLKGSATGAHAIISTRDSSSSTSLLVSFLKRRARESATKMKCLSSSPNTPPNSSSSSSAFSTKAHTLKEDVDKKSALPRLCTPARREPSLYDLYQKERAQAGGVLPLPNFVRKQKGRRMIASKRLVALQLRK